MIESAWEFNLTDVLYKIINNYLTKKYRDSLR